MSEKFDYDLYRLPPRPVILVELWNAGRLRNLDAQLAVLDTGADCSIVPEALVGLLELNLEQVDSRAIRTAGSDLWVLPTASIHLQIGQLPAVQLNVFVHPDMPYILLGRDLLNQYSILFDGPALTVSIS